MLRWSSTHFCRSLVINVRKFRGVVSFFFSDHEFKCRAERVQSAYFKGLLSCTISGTLNFMRMGTAGVFPG